VRFERRQEGSFQEPLQLVFEADLVIGYGQVTLGAGERGTAADLRKWNKGFRKFVATVKGGKDTGRAMTMPAWGGVLDEKVIFQIGAYVETLAIEGANWKEGVAQQ